ncbi:hypothetical protein K438DRAFT_1929123 [Mycena galopus ATCC 62051]|nr:hypothetical protein K438DRAFT_1929123 [Mycena galopus ATCC 62051]
MTTQPSPQNHFTGLSDSSVRCILQFLDEPELYNLSMTGVQMHQPALSMLLARHNIPNPLDEVEIRLPDIEVLRVLRVALFVSTIKRLLLRFSPGIFPWIASPYPPLTMDQLQATADCLLREMRHVRTLFSSLTSIDEITIILPGSLEWNLRDVNLERGDSADVFPWPQIVSFLQHALAKHCTLLKVENSTFRTQTLVRPGNATRRSLSGLFRKLLQRDRRMDMSALARWDGVKYRPCMEPHAAAGHSHGSLTHFYLQSTLLLFPSTAGWTFSVLQTSPIVSLHISGLEISRWDWELIGPKLVDAVPNLLELHLDDQRLEPDCLVKMLRRLPRLTSLTLVTHMSIELIHPHLFAPLHRLCIPAFHNLVKFSSSTSYASLFLMFQNPPPALTQLELAPIDIYRTATRHHQPLYIHIPHIIRRLRYLGHPLSPLPITISGWRGESSLGMCKHIDASLALNPKTAHNLREITHLVLSEGLDSLIDLQALCRWLRLFPSLQQISWNDSRSDRVAITNARLAREIFRACSTVDTIVTQGVRYSNIETVNVPPTVLPGFVELPSEVLLLIFNSLNEELFSLSILCRRLHFLALPVFFEKNIIPNPCEMVLVDFTRIPDPGMASPGPHDVVRALTVALFVPSIKHLTCVLPTAHTFQRLDGIARVTRLVQRLTTVENISLEFMPDYHRPGTFTWKDYSEARVWNKCYSALRDLLDAVDGKSCTSLTILGAPASNYATEAPSFPAPSLCSVTNLSLGATFSRGYHSWIFSALKTSPIASLKIDVTDDTQLNDDAANFPATLRSLSLDGNALRPTVLSYLGRHPLLENVTLGSALPGNKTSHLDPQALHLYNLVTLTGSLSYISPFFLHTTDSPFPVLERLTIVLDSGGQGVSWALASLIERVREGYSESQPPAIAVEITGFLLNVGSFAESIAFTSFMGGKWTHAARHVNELIVRYDPTWFTFSDTGAWVDPAAVQLLLDCFRAFNCARDITIQSSYGIIPVDALGHLAELIGEALSNIWTIRFKGQILFERL